MDLQDWRKYVEHNARQKVSNYSRKSEKNHYHIVVGVITVVVAPTAYLVLDTAGQLLIDFILESIIKLLEAILPAPNDSVILLHYGRN
jgi:hypothetical protein